MAIGLCPTSDKLIKGVNMGDYYNIADRNGLLFDVLVEYLEDHKISELLEVVKDAIESKEENR